MSTPTNNVDHDIYDDNTCTDPDSALVWPVLLATGSVQLGYVVGRISYSRDVRAAFCRIQASSEPIEISIRTL